VATNIEIATTAEIGPGLKFGHAGPIVIHGNAKIGQECTMGMGVVIGARGGNNAPVLGNRVRLGTYAVVLGNVAIGDGVRIGAMTLVITDVAAGERVGGVPAKVLKSRSNPESLGA
jgi:serine O-acetyltransferase